MTKAPGQGDDSLDWEDTLSLWEELGLDKESLDVDVTGTIRGWKRAIDTFEEFSLSALPGLSMSDESVGGADVPVELRLGALLGKGGMGEVRRARQIPLHRDVAVKRVRRERQHPKALMGLLREAWVMGVLEHPNVIPIYSLGADEEGHPVFVMKRVEGESWSALMHEPTHPLRKESNKDHLTWNLSILLQVCNALQFAHAKGIIHRDVKPSNVMIGRFGEVYLVDWGIAVSIRDDDGLPLRKLGESRELAGTPAYMAPEMAAAMPKAISVRSDVYQLGAVLHEILIGEPKHQGDELIDVLREALRSAPFDYRGCDVPEELGQLCNEATHADINERPEDAQVFAQRIDAFLEHRASTQLSDETQVLMERLFGVLDAFDGDAPHTEGSLSHQEIHELSSQCRFGMLQALRAWPGNVRAREALELLSARMAAYEISRGDASAASLFAAQMAVPDDLLQARIRELEVQQATEEARLAELEAMARDADVTKGLRGRTVITVIAGLLQFPCFVGLSHTFQWLPYHFGYFVLYVGCLNVGVLSMLAWFCRLPERNEAGMRIILSLLWLVVSFWCFLLLGWRFQLQPAILVCCIFFSYALYFGIASLLFEAGLWLAAAIHLLGFFLVICWPVYVFDVSAIIGPLGILSVPLSWFLSHRKGRALPGLLAE